jgi:hypothetical protein
MTIFDRVKVTALFASMILLGAVSACLKNVR